MRRALFGLSILVWLSSVLAGDKVEFGPVPSWVQLAPTADAGPATDAPVKFLLSDTQFNFSQSETEAFSETLMRVQTSQGLSAVGTLSLPWNPAIATLTVHKVHILRGGQIIDVLANGQTFTVLRRENRLEYATLNGVLTAVIQPAGLQVGDTIDLAYSVKQSDPLLVGTAEAVAGGWPKVPISHLRVRGRWTAPTAIRWKASPPMTGVVETRHGETTEVTAALDDPAPLLPPSGAPPRFTIGRQIQFSSFRSWSEIAERLAPLYEHAAALPANSLLHSEIARIRSTAPDAGARAMAALALVQDQVRYVFLGMNEGALVPTDADVTWARRFGDCKGKTALLLALLHGLDIRAEPIAVNLQNGDSVKSALPMVEAFNHVLVRADIAGKTYWLDGARSGDRRLDELTVPPYYWVLPLLKGSDLVQIVPTPLTQPGEEVTLEIDARGDPSAPAPLHAQAVLRGQSGAVTRFAIGNQAGDNRDRVLREFWSKAMEFAKVDSVSAQFDEQAGEEMITMDGSTRMDWNGDHYKLQGLDLSYKIDVKRTAGANSDAPLAVAFPSYVRAVETILLPEWPAPFTIDGKDIDRTVAGAEFHRRVRIAGGVLTAEASVRTLVPEIPFPGADVLETSLRQIRDSSVQLQAPAGYLASRGKTAPVESASAESSTVASAPSISTPPGDESLGPIAATPPSGVPQGPAVALIPPGEVRHGPPDPAANIIMSGIAMLNRGEYDKAIAEFARALQVNPRSPMAHAYRSMAYIQNGDSRALADLDAVEALDPLNPMVPRGRGFLALDSARYADAARCFTESLALEPGNVVSLTYRADAYQLSGDYDKALADTAAAIQRRPDYTAAYTIRADVLRTIGQPDAALKEAEALVTANPKAADAYVKAAEIYWSEGRDADAMSILQSSLETSPTVKVHLARAGYRARTDLNGRRVDVESALALDQRSQDALIMLAEIECDAGKCEDAVTTLNNAMLFDGESEMLLTRRAVAHAKDGQLDLAAQDLHAAREKSSAPRDLNDLCWHVATAGVLLDSALSACDAAVAQQPNHFHLDSRAFVLLRLGRYDDAIASYDSALQQQPQSSTSLYGRGVAKHRKGDSVAGDVDLKSAIEVDPHVATRFAEYGVKP